MRILEVNNHSLLGMTHTEAVRVLRAVGDSLVMLVCDGFDPQKVAAVEVRRHEAQSIRCRLFAGTTFVFNNFVIFLPL